VVGVNSVAGIVNGAAITGQGIQPNTTVQGPPNPASLTVTGTGALQTLTPGTITSNGALATFTVEVLFTPTVGGPFVGYAVYTATA
jgi:hypothetical protein